MLKTLVLVGRVKVLDLARIRMAARGRRVEIEQLADDDYWYTEFCTGIVRGHIGLRDYRTGADLTEDDLGVNFIQYCEACAESVKGGRKVVILNGRSVCTK